MYSLGAVPVTPLAVLQDSARTHAGDAALMARLGAAYVANGRYLDATEALNTALQLDTTLVPARFQLARAYSALARFPEAIQVVDDAFAWVPEDGWEAAELHNLRGFVYARKAAARGGVTNFRRDLLMEALSAYQRAVELAPDKPSYHLNLATVHDNLRRSGKALQHYQEAIMLYTASDRGPLSRSQAEALVRAHAAAGQLLAGQGEVSEAVAHLTRAVQMQPDEPAHRYELGRALAAMERYDEAEAEYQRALQQHPEFASARYALAELYLRTGRRQEGEAQMQVFHQLGDDADGLGALRAAVRRNPGDARLQLSLGSEYGRLHRYQDAEAQFRLAAQLDTSMGEPHFELGNLYLRSGDYQAAMRAFEAAARRMPDDADVLGNLGATYLRIGRHDRAIDVLTDAVRVAPDIPRLRYNLAVAMLFREDAEGAESELLEAVKLDSAYARAYAALAELYRSQGRSSEASAAAARAAALQPRTTPAASPSTASPAAGGTP